ncbi:hypothetical protein NS228_27375 [Methylobacterium indicum]|nr:hypothetical protein NS229_25890 [Methylobacterium indicum]KTS22263.1 hypothetical protein NS228_27375 [Methylobacterium indicum]KTS43307.1 hypothetical protein NS230_27040 [Methylobacterium indicum]
MLPFATEKGGEIVPPFVQLAVSSVSVVPEEFWIVYWALAAEAAPALTIASIAVNPPALIFTEDLDIVISP